MSTIRFHGGPANIVGKLPAVGFAAPAFALVAADLSDLTSESLADKRVALNIFPNIDTDVCAALVRGFSGRATSLDSMTVVCVSVNLPFAASRLCAAEGIDHVLIGSSFRSSFGGGYRVTLLGTPLAGFLTRAIVILDTEGTTLHRELVSGIVDAPGYNAIVAVL